MFRAYKRGRTFHVDCRRGRVRLVRGSLGTRNEEAAERIARKLESAVLDGPGSNLWSELKVVIPPGTFDRCVRVFGVDERQTITWKELRNKFESDKTQLVASGLRSARTLEHYQQCCDGFESFLADHRNTGILQDINGPLMQSFASWRLKRITRKNCTGERAMSHDLALLHHVFAFALDHEFIRRNPVKVPHQALDPDKGAQPFEPDEVALMQAESEKETPSLFPTKRKKNRLPFLLPLRTGLRRADLVRLRWQDVDMERRQIRCKTRKKRKTVRIPVLPDLYAALKAEFEFRDPLPGDTVLLDPKTGRPFKDNDLWRFVSEFGKRAGVVQAYPHRFRDTFAVDMLIRTNGDAYSVANLLGDTMQVVMKHYLPNVKALQQKVERQIRKSRGLERYATRRPRGKG